ncbi:hypothetical protein PVAND_011162 [Polypedilum vanderplanki]|uniref:Uncharacterized protein n=1 Tax=Polypedilum vanderplanki TaxID=319348 RepID=A0A9J6CHR9_POLVA|nr:hypothetical protein PVAND_011162 [Polypedilum vanderplanki]
MSKLLSLFKLCPINNDILGVSADAERSSVICTLGKKIVYLIELSTQKNIKSWSSLDNFTSKVIYDFKRKQYVGVFSNTHMRFWDINTEDINKVKKIKFHKPIYEIINVSDENILVIYADGTTKSLDKALESRKTEKHQRDNVNSESLSIENTQFGNEIFSYVKKANKEKIFCFTSIDNTTLQQIQKCNEIKLNRPGLNVRLMGHTTMYSSDGSTYLITIWSDKRMFKLNLNLHEKNLSIGTFHTIIDSINVSNDIAVQAVSENCLAIYAKDQNEDGSSIILYNIKYKIIQSKLSFKVYLSNFKLWSVHENLYLAMAQHLSVIPFVVTTDKMSSLIGLQVHTLDNIVENEMINEDALFEDALTFDENQDEVKGMEFIPNDIFIKRNRKKLLSGAKPIADSDEIQDSLDRIYRGDLIIDVQRCDNNLSDTAALKILNNIDEPFPLISENFEYYCMNLERYGCSEIEITDKVVPVLLKANRTEDIAILLKRYNHVSEKMLVQIIKYLLNSPIENPNSNEKAEEKIISDSSNNLTLSEKNKKYKNKNVFLSADKEENCDVLSIALCCAFDSTTILKHLSSDITLNEMIQLMDHLYKILTTNVLDDVYDMKGNLVEGDDFDLDTKLFEWFRLLLDSHYQQIILSRDNELKEKFNTWLELIDNHVEILSQMKDMRYTLVKIASNKRIDLSRKCNRWYSIEKLELKEQIKFIRSKEKMSQIMKFSRCNQLLLKTIHLNARAFCNSARNPSPTSATETVKPITKDNQKVSDWEKKLLVWMKKYENVDEIPNFVTMDVVDRARQEFRMRIFYATILFLIASYIVIIMSGKTLASQGDLIKLNQDWHRAYEKSHQDENTDTVRK